MASRRLLRDDDTSKEEIEEVAPVIARGKRSSAKQGGEKKRRERHTWTQQEDLALLRAVKNDGVGNWGRILDTVQKDRKLFGWCEVRFYVCI